MTVTAFELHFKWVTVWLLELILHKKTVTVQIIGS